MRKRVQKATCTKSKATFEKKVKAVCPKPDFFAQISVLIVHPAHIASLAQYPMRPKSLRMVHALI